MEFMGGRVHQPGLENSFSESLLPDMQSRIRNALPVKKLIFARKPGLLGALLCVAMMSQAPIFAQSSQPTSALNVESLVENAMAGTATSERQIEELIELLGSDSYATRIRARNRLKRFGLQAFDALRQAQNHSDSEILSAARFLMSSLQVSWSKESDSDEVRALLQEYGGQDDSERARRIEQLGILGNDQGIEALARLTRFELSIPLSRRAAMILLERPIGKNPEERLAAADAIERAIGGNNRDGCQWLLAYAADVRNGTFDFDRWSTIVNTQRDIVNNGSSDNVTAASVMDLIRKISARAIEEGQFDAAVDLVRDNADLVPQRTLEISQHCDWALRKGLYPVVVSLFDNNQHLFRQHARLLYAVAYATLKLGKKQLSHELAEQAFGIDPFPVATNPREKLDSGDEGAPEGDGLDDGGPDTDAPGVPQPVFTDHQREQLGKRRRLVANALLGMGLVPWAEREYRYIYENCNIEMSVGVTARLQTAELYNERLRHNDVTEVLYPVVDRLRKDGQYRAMMARDAVQIKQIESLYEYNSALAILEANVAPQDEPTEGTGEVSDSMERVKSHLLKAYKHDRRNIDILIKMYRIDDPNDNDWKPLIQKMIQQERTQLEAYIGNKESSLKRQDSPRTKLELASFLNQYAWLVANTEGDFQRAVRASKRSLELDETQSDMSRSARLDTLARCYFAVGDLSKAIETQERAIKLEPNSPQMKRQLEEFRRAYKDEDSP